MFSVGVVVLWQKMMIKLQLRKNRSARVQTRAIFLEVMIFSSASSRFCLCGIFSEKKTHQNKHETKKIFLVKARDVAEKVKIIAVW